jgi:hypothetical protein
MRTKNRINMIKAYIKGLDIISSCKNTAHITASYNWIDNFRKIYGSIKETEKLIEVCSLKRRALDLI